MEFHTLALRVAGQGDRHRLIERYKSYFATATGSSHNWSSSEGWAETDLRDSMVAAAVNPPLFLEGFWLACESIKQRDGFDIPDAHQLNEICARHGVDFRIDPPRVQLAGAGPSTVSAPEAPSGLADSAAESLRASRARADQLLAEGRAREAVQEMLWILESLTTAFHGLETQSGKISGKYFNEIVRDLRRTHPGTTLDRVSAWCETLHGYLSSPTGGGVRHGLDLKTGIALNAAEGRLMCNLITSYIGYLLSEYERLST